MKVVVRLLAICLSAILLMGTDCSAPMHFVTISYVVPKCIIEKIDFPSKAGDENLGVIEKQSDEYSKVAEPFCSEVKSYCYKKKSYSQCAIFVAAKKRSIDACTISIGVSAGIDTDESLDQVLTRNPQILEISKTIISQFTKGLNATEQPIIKLHRITSRSQLEEKAKRLCSNELD